MRNVHRVGLTVGMLLLLSAVSSADRLSEERVPRGIDQQVNITDDQQVNITDQRIDVSAGSILGGFPTTASIIVVDRQEVEGVLGKEVRSIADENMGRIIEVVVDRSGQVRAAVIDFGGFLGVGSRKIAVDWSALRFGPAGQARGSITVELTRDQVRAAPEYKEGKAVVMILGALGNVPSLPLKD
jgi:hypothetical protein